MWTRNLRYNGFSASLPNHIKDRIEYDNPKTLEEVMRKANLCYEQNRKNESMRPTGRPKRIIIMIKRRKSLCLIEVLKIIMPEIFLIIRISRGIKIIHRTIKKIRSLLIITVITQRNLNEKNP